MEPPDRLDGVPRPAAGIGPPFGRDGLQPAACSRPRHWSRSVALGVAVQAPSRRFPRRRLTWVAARASELTEINPPEPRQE